MRKNSFNWSSKPIGIDDHEYWSWSPIYSWTSGALVTRRRFLQAAAASAALPASSALALDDPLAEPEETTGLRFDLSADGEFALVTLVALPLSDAPFSNAKPSTTTRSALPVWRIPRAAFGPKAKFRLSRGIVTGTAISPGHAGGLSGRIALHVRDASFVRRGPATVSFIFEYDEGEKKKPVNPLDRWSVHCTTDLWLGPSGGKALLQLGSESDPGRGVPFAELTGWSQENSKPVAATPLRGTLSAARANCTLMEVFNGLVRLEGTTADVTLVLGPDFVWKIDPGSVPMHGLAQGISLPDLRFGWVRELDEDKTDSKNEEAVSSDTALTFKPGQYREAVVGGPSKPLETAVTLSVSGGTGPQPTIKLNSGAKMLLAASLVGQPDELKGLAGTVPIHRVEAAVVGTFDLTVLSRPGKSERSGAFESLDGLLRRRVDAKAAFACGTDPLGEGDEIVFFASGPGKEDVFEPRRAARTIESPFGGLSFAVPPAADFETRIVTKVDPAGFEPENPYARDPLGNPSGSPVFVRNTGAGWDLEASKRQTRWLEVNGLILASHLALPDASWSHLTFHANDLVFLYTDSPLEVAPRNYIWLGDGAVPNAPFPMRLDLSAARLAAARCRDLVSLRFGFLDLFLVHDGERFSIRPRGDACGIHARAPGLLGHPGPAAFRPLPPSVMKGAEEDDPSVKKTVEPKIDHAPVIQDNRPILVVEFPPQHILEEAAFKVAAPPLPDLVWEEKNNGPGHWFTVDPDAVPLVLVAAEQNDAGAFSLEDGAAIAALLRLLPTVARRVELRQLVLEQKKKWLMFDSNKTLAEDFKQFVGAFGALKILPNDKYRKPVPDDQRIYIGPYGMDPDVAGWARALRLEGRKERAAGIVKAMFDAVDAQAALLSKGVPPPTGLELEAKLESAVPTYQLFRTFYRDDMAARSLGMATTSSANALKFPDECAPKPGGPSIEFYLSKANVAGSCEEKLLTKYFKPLFVEQLLAEDKYRLVEGRLANPSRLAFRVNCVDGLARGRNVSNSPWLEAAYRRHAKLRPGNAGHQGHAGEHPAAIGVDQIEFSLRGLTEWTSMELSVIDRAQEVFVPAHGRRLDSRSNRRINLLGSAALDHLGFLPSSQPSERDWEFRADKIRNSLSRGPQPYETSIELPARLILSPSQRATFRAPGSVHRAIYADTPQPVDNIERFDEIPDAGGDGSHALWHARLIFDESLGNPQVRAVYSPDLAPNFVDKLRHASGLGATADNPVFSKGDLPNPGGGAPPRGPYAPWLLDRAQTSKADLLPGDYAAWVAEHNAGRIDPPPPSVFLKDDSGNYLGMDSENICNPKDVPASKFRDSLPLMIDDVCRRFGLRKKPVLAGDADPRKFRTSLDAYDRHELVLLSSAYGLPVQAKTNRGSTLPGSGSGQFEPDTDYQIRDILRGSEIYRPRSLNVTELTLTALGGSLRHDTSFEPPASARYHNGLNLFDALSIERWQHQTALGRDIFCEVVYKGYLLPYMFRASLVKVTERVFAPLEKGGTTYGFLRQRMYIRCAEPLKRFPLAGQQDGGRGFPPADVTLLTTTTPDIIDPNDDLFGGQTTGGVSERPTGRLQFANAPGLVFWPRTMKAREGDVRFQIRIDSETSEMPMLFVDNVAVNDAETLELVRGYYNNDLTPDEIPAGIAATGGDKAALPAYDPTRHRRSMAFSSAKIRYADEAKTGSASIETDLMTLRIEGRRLQDAPEPAGFGNAPSNPLAMDVKTHRLAGTDHVFDQFLQGADQPPIYPVIETTRIRLKQNETLTGRQGQLYRAFYDGHYVQYGFAPPEGVTVGAGSPNLGASADAARKNGLDVFLTLLDPASQEMNDNGEQSGGVFQPKSSLIAVSRRKGPVSSSLRPTSYDALTILRAGNRLGLASVFGERAIAKEEVKTSIPPPDTKTTVTTQTDSSKKAKEQVRTVLQDIFADAKLLGIVELRKVIAFIGDQFLSSAEENVPGLLEIIRYGAALTKEAESASTDITDYIRQQLLEPLSGVVRQAISRWEALDDDLRDMQSNKAGLTDITIALLFFELDAALRGFDAAIESAKKEGDPILFAISLGVVYERGRTLIDETKRAAANPGEGFENAIKDKVGELKTLAEALLGDLGAVLATLQNMAALELAGYLADVLVPGEDDEVFTTVPFPIAPLAWLEKVAGLSDEDLEKLKDLRQPHVKKPGTNLLEPLTNKIVHRAVAVSLRQTIDQLLKSGKVTPSTALEPLNDLAVRVHAAQRQKFDALADPLKKQFAVIKDEIAAYSAQLAALKNAWSEIDKNPDAFLDDPLVAPLIEQYRTPINTSRATLDDVTNAQGAIRAGNPLQAMGLLRGILARHGIDIPVPDHTAQIKTVLEGLKGALLFGPVEFLRPHALCTVVGQGTDVKIKTTDEKGKQIDLDASTFQFADPGGVVSKQRLLALLTLNQQLTNLHDDKPKIPDKPSQVENTANVLEEFLYGRGSEPGLHRINADLLVALINDASMVAGLRAKVEGFTFADLNKLENIGNDLRRLAAYRKAALRQAGAHAEVLRAAVHRLITSNDQKYIDARTVLLAGGSLVALADKYGFDPSAVADEVKEYLVSTSTALVKMVASHAARVCEHLQKVLDAAAGVAAKAETVEAFRIVVPQFSAELFSRIRETHAVTSSQLALKAANFNKIVQDIEAGAQIDPMIPVDLHEFDNCIKKFLEMTDAVGETSLLAKLDRDLRSFIDIQARLGHIETQLGENAYVRLDALAEKILNAEVFPLMDKKVTISQLFDALLAKRNAAYEGLDGLLIRTPATNLLVWPPRSERPLDYTPAGSKDDLSTTNDRLAGDVAWLKHVTADDAITDHEKRTFIIDFLSEMAGGQPTPVVIVKQVIDLVRSLLRGDISLDEFINVQEIIEGYILDLVPAKIEHHFDLALPLPKAVEQATLGIFIPGDGCRLTVRARISVDLFTQEIKTEVEGRLGAFDIKLVGTLFDALTLRFGGAEFRSRNGGGHDFEIVYLDYVIGPQLEFIEQLQSFLSPKEGSGAYLEMLQSMPGIEAGYRLNLGVISLGTVSFFNVSLNTAAVLPFTNGGEALFRAGLSSPTSPFVISYLPFGGAGFVSIYANARGIVGIELGFDFGAAGAFAAGPLTGQGRIMAGLYIRTLSPPNQPKLSEISSTFFAGGSANIWIFSFSASLYVKLGMVNGAMTGLAVFTFSFSMGIVDYDYSVKFERTESKGYSGSQGGTASLLTEQDVQYADLGSTNAPATQPPPAFNPGNAKIAQVRADTTCLSDDWSVYLSYFDDTPLPGEVMQHG